MLRKILIFIPMLFCILMGRAMFFTGAGAAALALFKGKSNLLWVSISLLGLTLLGRLFEITSSGIGETTMQPIIIEAALVAMLLGALKLSKKEA